MDRKSIIGLVLVGIILFGFSWYQSKQLQKHNDANREQLEQIRNEALVDLAVDSLKRMEAAAPADSVATPDNSGSSDRYFDAGLRRAYVSEDVFPVLKNNRLEITFNSRGAQIYKVKVLDFKSYGEDSLILVKPGASDFDISVSAGQKINTHDFCFDTVSVSDSSVVFRLFFEDGAYIQQMYVLPEDSYMLRNELTFHGMKNLIPRSTKNFSIRWLLDMPRLEKGFKNEKQYSKMDVLCMGEKDPEITGGGRDSHKEYPSSVYWFDFNQQFFSAIMTADKGFAAGTFDVKFAQENDPEKVLMRCSAETRNALELKDGEAVYGYDFYFGPNNYRILRSFGRNYEKVITIGGKVIGLITRFVIIPCFELLHRFIANFGIIILILTVLLKLILSPLTSKSYLSSAKMNALKPEIDKLNLKFPKANEDRNQALKKQQATMELYKRAGVKPLGGCLPMLLQLPILWAMFRFFPASIELRQQPFLWADDLSAYDSICDFGFRILGVDHISLFALLMALSMFFYSKMTMPKSNDPQMAPMRFMSVWLMPIMMFFICNGLSSALSYYYLLSNIFTMLQTFIIKKFFVHPEKMLAQLEANRNKPLPKSKWQIRLEEAQKAAQKQQAMRRK